MGLNMILALAGGLVVLGVLVVFVLIKKRTAYLGPVKEELQKEKMWLRRGEYNAAMVKGRQNLELLLRLVAEKNGIQLDNTAKAQADAREEEERRNQNGRANQSGRGNQSGHGNQKHRGRGKTQKVMTHHQFNRWLSENGYLDRVARWEMNQVRIIGNKAVHENFADKDDAWNQFNYLEDILKTITERSQNPGKRQTAKKQMESHAKEVPVKGTKAKQNARAKKQAAGAAVKTPAKAEQTKKQTGAAVPAKAEQVKKQAVVLAKVDAENGGKVAEENAEKSKRRRRRKKKPQTGHAGEGAQKEEAVKTVVIEPAKEENSETAKKKRRRCKKKPQAAPAGENAQKVEIAASAETTPKTKTEKKVDQGKATSPVQTTNQENSEAVKKKRRRCKKKPQAAQAGESVQTTGATQTSNSVQAAKPIAAETSNMAQTTKPAANPAQSAAPADQEKSDAAKKNHRRRRRRKPKSSQSGANENAGVGVDG